MHLPGAASSVFKNNLETVGPIPIDFLMAILGKCRRDLMTVPLDRKRCKTNDAGSLVGTCCLMVSVFIPGLPLK